MTCLASTFRSVILHPICSRRARKPFPRFFHVSALISFFVTLWKWEYLKFIWTSWSRRSCSSPAKVWSISLRWDSKIPVNSCILLLSESAWNSCFWISVLTSARICSFCLSKRILICSFSESRLGFSLLRELSEPNSCTGLSVLARQTDKDWAGNKLSSKEWQACLWMNSGEDSAVPMISSSSSASHEYESSVSMSPDSSWKIIEEVYEWWKSPRTLGLITCEKMVFRHGAILLIVRRRGGFIPRRCRHIGDGVQSRVQIECGREEVNNGEKQEKDNHEETNNERSSTHHGWHEDGMKRAHRQIGWLVLSHAVWYACNLMCKLHEKNDVWNVSVYTLRRLQWVAIDNKRNQL